ncbi:hypothetical protein IQ244_22440 [Nostoc sp. LEGE 06077]|uniref:hypothetical protein n=1 Tax=Nostoc sp. LEGE 06077 TaxID=915325 RepID=UPI00187E18B3|nr:hypothetical protein [Nostoc sp. LEGE 06077]MBE9209215.1 hypothetical protein [Nostoc sp. LEGE 06077]
MNNKTIHPFQQVFFAVIFLTILSGGSSVLLAFQKELSPEQTRVFEICNTTWNMGIGAIFGLLGSKATNLFSTDQKEGEE